MNLYCEHHFTKLYDYYAVEYRRINDESKCCICGARATVEIFSVTLRGQKLYEYAVEMCNHKKEE